MYLLPLENMFRSIADIKKSLLVLAGEKMTRAVKKRYEDTNNKVEALERSAVKLRNIFTVKV
jgi:hypothetical protein